MEPKVELYNRDCIAGMAEMPENTVHLVVTSIPFEELFTYSGKVEDVGNNGSTVDIRKGRFALNMRFVVEQLFRVLAPGCNACIHIQQLLAYKVQHQYMGRRDFRGSMIDVFGAGGFDFYGEFVIPKNPQAMAQRLNLHSLMFATAKRNGSMLAPAVNDYVLIFHKPGEHPHPPKVMYDKKKNPSGWVTSEEWIRDASGIWSDIQEIDILDGARGAKEHKHEKHVCVARGSLVLTRTGYKPIEKVAVGDLVLTHKGRWRPVLATVCNGVRECVQMHAQGVPNLKLTPDHQVYTRSGIGTHSRQNAIKSEPTWMRADQTIGHYVQMPLPPIEHDQFGLTDTEWWLVGRWLADGHRGVRGDYFISVGPDKVEEFKTKAGKHAGFSRVAEAVQFRLKKLRPQVKEVLSQCGLGAENKRVPVAGLVLPCSRSRQLLEGYLSGDGHYLQSRRRWTASSVSRELLLGVSMLVQRVYGAIPSVYAGKKPGTTTIEGRTVRTMQDWVLSFDIPGGRRVLPFVMEDGAWKKVRSVQSGDGHPLVCEVWDLKVQEDESFTVEGCVVHNCPLQLEVIRRLVRLYTNPITIQPDVTVLDPFMGIGSTAYVAVGGASPMTKLSVEEPRNCVGFELKESYHRASLDYVERALKSRRDAATHTDLFTAIV